MAPMGPLFQVIMRSLSKPVSNSIVSLASNHPKLRKYLFIPVGQALIRLTIRLRMQNLGFGKPNTVAEVTEAAAIQEAADVASFSLFVALSLGIYQMARWLTPELAKKSDFDTAVAELQEKITELQIRLDKAEVVANASNVIAPNRIANQPINAARKTDDVKKEKVVRSEPILSKITALPIDEATRITLSGTEQFIVVRRGYSVCIESLEYALLRATPYKFSEQSNNPEKIGCLLTKAAYSAFEFLWKR